MASTALSVVLLVLCFTTGVVVGKAVPDCVAVDEMGSLFRLEAGGGVSGIGNTGFRDLTALTWDPAASVFLVYTAAKELVAVDPVTATGRTLRVFVNGPTVTGMAVYRESLFAVTADTPSAHLLQLQAPFHVGQWKDLGPLRDHPSGFQGLAVDPETGALYAMSPSKGFCVIDPLSAQVRVVRDEPSPSALQWRAVSVIAPGQLMAVADRGAATVYTVNVESGTAQFWNALERSRVRGLYCHPSKDAFHLAVSSSVERDHVVAHDSTHTVRNNGAPVQRRVISFPDAFGNNGLTIIGPIDADVGEYEPDVTEERYFSDFGPETAPSRGIEFDTFGQPSRLRIAFEGGSFTSLGFFGSICDVSSTSFVDVASPFGGSTAIVPEPGYAYVTPLGARPAGQNSYLLVWIDPVSRPDLNMLKMEYEWWTPASSRPTDANGEVCYLPKVNSIGLQGGWPSAQKLWITGRDFGESAFDLHRIQLTPPGSQPIECDNVNLEVPRFVLSCTVYDGNGVGSVSGNVNGVPMESALTYSWNDFDPIGLNCGDGEYPNIDGSACVCSFDGPCFEEGKVGTPDSPKFTRMSSVLSGLMTELNLAQRRADDTFLATSNSYRDPDDDLSKLSVQRYSVPSAAFQLHMTMEEGSSSNDIKVNPVTSSVTSYDVNRLARVRMSIRGEEARWIASLNPETNQTEYVLDL